MTIEQIVMILFHSWGTSCLVTNVKFSDNEYTFTLEMWLGILTCYYTLNFKSVFLKFDEFHELRFNSRSILFMTTVYPFANFFQTIFVSNHMNN